nr:hypothetical protein [Bacilli bacterium]
MTGKQKFSFFLLAIANITLLGIAAILMVSHLAYALLLLLVAVFTTGGGFILRGRIMRRNRMSS